MKIAEAYVEIRANQAPLDAGLAAARRKTVDSVEQTSREATRRAVVAHETEAVRATSSIGDSTGFRGSIFGRGSALGLGGRALTLGGPLLAVGIAARLAENMANAAKEAAVGVSKGTLSRHEAFGQVAESTPIIGEFLKVGAGIREIFRAREIAKEELRSEQIEHGKIENSMHRQEQLANRLIGLSGAAMVAERERQHVEESIAKARAAGLTVKETGRIESEARSGAERRTRLAADDERRGHADTVAAMDEEIDLIKSRSDDEEAELRILHQREDAMRAIGREVASASAIKDAAERREKFGDINERAFKVMQRENAQLDRLAFERKRRAEAGGINPGGNLTDKQIDEIEEELGDDKRIGPMSARFAAQFFQKPRSTSLSLGDAALGGTPSDAKSYIQEIKEMVKDAKDQLKTQGDIYKFLISNPGVVAVLG